MTKPKEATTQRARPARKAKPGPAAAEQAAATPSPSKGATLRSLLERSQGATIAQMVEATAWQAHSVRGFMSGTLKKKLGLQIVSSKDGAERVYRVVDESLA